MQVLFTPLAERQIENLYNYIASQSGDRRADAYFGRIVGFCQGLSDFPQRGTARDDVFPGLRTIGFERRVTVAFVITPDAVLIEGVFYGGQDFETALRE